jgi:two-component system, NarL family, sensor histidine kinase DegS
MSSLPARASRILRDPSPLRLWRGIRGRMHEREFWIIQIAVVATTILHTGMEAAGFDSHQPGLLGMLTHIPVILYIVPVSYAGLRYGFEGSALTGAWVTVLAAPNLFIWHANGLEWLGELLLVAVVVSIGMVIAIPVEREQRERARAEAVGRRLALLNEVTVTLMRTADLEDALRRTLHRLLHILPLRTVTLRADGRDPVHSGLRISVERDADELYEIDPPSADGHPTHREATGMLCFPINGGHGEAMVCVEVLDGESLSASDRELLTTVAAEVGVALDNARLHRLNADRLKSYVHQVTRAQEEERLRIARELHDVATHELLLLCRDFDGIIELPPGAELLPERVEKVRDRAGGIVDYLRRFSRDLRPTILDNLGLAPALQWLTMELRDESEADARFRLIGESLRLAPDVEIALFRVAQEALRNADRHAGAKQVTVSLTYDGDLVEMEIADDGCGFDVPVRLDGLVPAGKLGLLGMRERIQLIGGEFRVDSRPGAGTTVAVSFGSERPEHALSIAAEA